VLFACLQHTLSSWWMDACSTFPGFKMLINRSVQKPLIQKEHMILIPTHYPNSSYLLSLSYVCYLLYTPSSLIIRPLFTFSLSLYIRLFKISYALTISLQKCPYLIPVKLVWGSYNKGQREYINCLHPLLPTLCLSLSLSCFQLLFSIFLLLLFTWSL
jgi:hypothetical protein